MRTTPKSDGELRKAVAASRPLAPGWYDVEIFEAVDTLSKRDKPTIALRETVFDGKGGEREQPDWLSDSAFAPAAAKLRAICEAVGALAQYEAGEVSADQFVGRRVRVLLEIERKRGYPDRNRVVSYSAADTRVVNLRSSG